MEQWTVRDDRPYYREPRSSAYLWWMFFLVLALAVGAAAYYLWPHKDLFSGWSILPASPEAVPAPAPAIAAAATQPAVEATPREPVLPEPAAALPSLENSDGLMRETVSDLVGRKAFDTMVYPSQLIRRIVATVDNLPRETAPRRVMPVEPVPGALGVAGSGEELTLGAANAARYAPYVRVFEALDARSLVRRYFDSYPLFQRAYVELGFPNRRFHDRLLEAIDDLIAAPELAQPVRLVRPKVLYQFADPQLEGLSAGQKVMIRIGADNAAKVKAKLREIRRELARQAR